MRAAPRMIAQRVAAARIGSPVQAQPQRALFFAQRRREDPSDFSGREIQGPDGKEYVLLVVTDISAQKRIE
jgi:hypothetical protein